MVVSSCKAPHIFLALTSRLAGPPGYNTQYPEVGEADDYERNEVHRHHTEQVIGHLLSRGREEAECDTLVEVRDVRVLLHVEHHTLKQGPVSI